MARRKGSSNRIKVTLDLDPETARLLRDSVSQAQWGVDTFVGDVQSGRKHAPDSEVIKAKQAGDELRTVAETFDGAMRKLRNR